MPHLLPPPSQRGFIAVLVLIVLVVMVLGYCDVQRTLGGHCNTNPMRAVP